MRKEVATIAVVNGSHLLMGRRNDNGKWTNPGGHLDDGETPLDGAIRELAEETGIEVSPEDMEFLGSEDIITPTGKQYTIHTFRYISGTPELIDVTGDPDAETNHWSWVDISNNCLPLEVRDNLHSPKNVLFNKLGLSYSSDKMNEALISEREYQVDYVIKNPPAYAKKHKEIWKRAFTEYLSRQGIDIDDISTVDNIEWNEVVRLFNTLLGVKNKKRPSGFKKGKNTKLVAEDIIEMFLEIQG